jgi:photosystem II stability/assembly factor-like uncharacterized protein
MNIEGFKKVLLFLKKKQQKNCCSLRDLAKPAPTPPINRSFLLLFFKKEVACLLFAAMTANPAFANDAVAVALDRPATMTRLAPSGLFTAVTTAGTRLVAVGERGRIMVSDDDGVNWRQVPCPTSVTLTAVVFATPASGWVLGQMGVVLRTADGGLNWVRQLDGMQANQATMEEAEADVARLGNNDTTAAIMQNAEALVGGGPSVPFLALLPLTPAHLLLAGGFGLALESRDGGAHWVSVAGGMANPNGLHVYGLVRDQNEVFAVGEQGLFLAGTGGMPDQAVATPFPGTFFGAVVTPAHSLILYGLQGTILRSTDLAAHWQLPQSGVADAIDAGLLLRDGRILLGDVAGTILLSRDDGQTFHPHQAGEPVAGLAQAPDGSIIVAGPFGLRRIPLAALNGA